jgi:DNA-directed RNA polymerase subunit beta'
LEYDIPVFFTIKTGAEGLLELIEKIDIAGLIIALRDETVKQKDKDTLSLLKD